jgi:hypothetical protein
MVPISKAIRLATLALCAAGCAMAQDTPLISGAAAFYTNTPGGKTTYVPTIQPLLAAPLGEHFLVETRAAITETFSPSGPGYDHARNVNLTYLSGDYFATPHLTIVGGSFLLPFNTYNERLTPLWIGNFLAGPIILPLGTMNTGVGTGGMARGNAVSQAKYSVDYAAFYSTRVGNQSFQSERSFGGRSSLYLPDQRLEIGISYDRVLQGTHENFYGGHLWWEPKETNLRVRSEFSRGHHAQGGWIEADYRTRKFGGLDSWIGRFEPVVRWQQTFRRDTLISDSLPLVNTQRIDFEFDYNLPHNTRVVTSYSRQFASTGNKNIWETMLVYRFLFPAWKGKS